MSMFVSLLRGINVAAQKTIRMADLKALYEQLGFSHVRTYLQSGNVVFESPDQAAETLAETIEAQIERSFDFPVSILMRNGRELQQVIDSNPFLHGRNEDPGRLYVTFIKSSLSLSKVSSLKIPEGEMDEFVVSEKEIFLFCPNGYGRTKLSNTFFEKKLDLTATTRNWNTVLALRQMAQEGH